MALENTYLSIIKKENLSNWFIEIEATQITRLQYTIHYKISSWTTKKERFCGGKTGFYEFIITQLQYTENTLSKK